MAKRKRKKTEVRHSGGERSEISPGFDPGKDQFMSLMARKVAESGLETPEEINAFLAGNFMGKNIDDLVGEEENPSPHFQAIAKLRELDDASTPEEVEAVIEAALEIDPLCCDAWMARADFVEPGSENAGERLRLIRKAVEAGREKHADLITPSDSSEGSRSGSPELWGWIEARPFMMAMEALAEAHMSRAEFDRAVELFEELLQLNFGDNQGIRYRLLPLLNYLGEFMKAEALLKRYPDDISCEFLYGRALTLFNLALEELEEPEKVLNFESARPFARLRSSRMKAAREALGKAIRNCPWGPVFLLDVRSLLVEAPLSFRVGSPEEALVMGQNAYLAWVVPELPAIWLISEFDQSLEAPRTRKKLRESFEEFADLWDWFTEEDVPESTIPENPEEEGGQFLEFQKVASDIGDILLEMGSAPPPSRGRW